MKKLFTMILIGMLLLSLVACGDDDGPPNMRINNKTSSTINVSFKQEGSSTVNINGIDPEAFSDYREVATVPTRVEGLPGGAFLDFTPQNGNNYTVVVLSGSNSYVQATEQ